MSGLLSIISEVSKNQCWSHRFTTQQIFLSQAAKQQQKLTPATQMR